MKQLLLITFLLLASVGQTQTKAERLDSLMTARYNDKTFNGNVLFAENGVVIFQKSYGFANEQAKEPLNINSVFELASVSKQFTAMAIVLLQKQGKLQYDDLVSKHIPELSIYPNVTVLNLLHHTGGLPDYMELFEQKWDKSKIATNDDIISMFAIHKPAIVFEPNAKFEYSNTGYALLASIIERASKKSYSDYLEQNIFKVLGLKNTQVYQSRYKPRKITNYAYGYVADSLGGKVLPDSFGKKYFSYYLDGITGDGIVNSTVGDLFKWDRALYTEKLVTAKEMELILTSGKTSDGKDTRYGFGWFVSDSPKYGRIASHSGGWFGYITYIERNLKHDKTMILLQNNSLPRNKYPNVEARKIMFGEKLDVTKLVKHSPQSSDLDKYLGVYSSPGFPLKITITKNGNALVSQATGQSTIPLDSYENHIFTFDPGGIRLTFSPSSNTMQLTQGFNDLKFTRE